MRAAACLVTLAILLAACGDEAPSAWEVVETPPDGWTPEQPPATYELKAPAARNLSGYVTDLRTGLPVANALVTTEPPTEAVTTNLQGLFVLTVGQSWGPIAVRVSASGYRQAAPLCVHLDGPWAIADVAMARVGQASDEPCDPVCADGEVCEGGRCLTRCNPACVCGSVCDAAGVCQPDGTAPRPECGFRAEPFGQTMCRCEPGYLLVPGLGSCAPPSAFEQCPEGATLGPDGCVCWEGYAPDEAYETCVSLWERARPRPLVLGGIVARWPAPGPRPVGLAFDGVHHWVGDALTDTLYEVAYRAAADEGEVVATHPLGGRGGRLRALAWHAPHLLVLTEPDPAVGGLPVLERFDPEAGAFEPLPTPGAWANVRGFVDDGETLYAAVHGAWPGTGALRWQLHPMADGLARLEDPTVTIEASGTDILLSPTFTRRQFVLAQRTWFDGASGEVALSLHMPAGLELDYAGSWLGALDVPVPNTHLTGLVTRGDALWLMTDGDGLLGPTLEEVRVE